MESMRSTWTDERMDDLNHRVDDVGRRMDNRFDHVEARIDSMQRTMIQVGGGMIATLIAGFAALIATRL